MQASEELQADRGKALNPDAIQKVLSRLGQILPRR